MFFFNKPSDEFIRQYISTHADDPFNYLEVGASAEENAPNGYNLDHNRIRLGKGRDIFNKAKAALRSWKMFDLGWIDLCWPNTPIETGSVVGILARHLGFWSLNMTRIIYVIQMDN